MKKGANSFSTSWKITLYKMKALSCLIICVFFKALPEKMGKSF